MRIVAVLYSTPDAVGWHFSFNRWVQPIQKFAFTKTFGGMLYENFTGTKNGWIENYDLPLTALVNDF